MPPSDIYQHIAAVVFLVAAVDLGIGFLMRGVRESGSDPHD